MGDPTPAEPKFPTLHPAYSVTNILTKIRKLDGTDVTFSLWRKLFKLHAKAYKVLDHIDGTDTSANTSDNYLEWSEIDSLAWLKLEAIFWNNKRARAAALKQDFTNLRHVSCSSMDDYCQKLKNIADHLADMDQTVYEGSLVTQLVNGLPKEYAVVAAIINQSASTWDDQAPNLILNNVIKMLNTNHGSH
ncbi:uncharacterized protein LOC143560731 [Bidens hawaiensis]|uniref:uncharacterized protein LOC143560731 n=1 Tax=Bidens hawaiensis TaxID=980011 RepID=UPI00404947EE